MDCLLPDVCYVRVLAPLCFTLSEVLYHVFYYSCGVCG